MAAAVVASYEKVAKADPVDWRGLVSIIGPQLSHVYAQGGSASYSETGASGPFNQLNDLAAQYARDRAAELVGMKWVDGKLVPNPNAQWAITDTTRQQIHDLIERAIEEGMSPDDLAQAIEDIIDDPARAATIAETELAMAQQAGSIEGWRASGVVSGKTWLLSNDHNEPDECDDNADAGVVGLDEAFPSGDDTAPAHPNCLLPDAVVAAGGITAYFKRWFAGKVVRIRTENGHDLTVTPNHPVLTGRGWIAAGRVVEGDYLVESSDPRAAVAFLNPDDHNVPSRVEQIFDAAVVTSQVAPRTMPLTAKAFHGDAIADSEVEIVWAYRPLECERKSATVKFARQLALGLRHVRRMLFARLRTTLQLLGRSLAPADSGVRVGGRALALRFRRAAHAVRGHRNAIANRKAEAVKAIAQSGTVAAERLGNLNRRLPGLIAAVKVADVSFAEYFGHVYNLSTGDQFYFANGLVVHNCYCDVAAVVEGDDEEAA